MGLKTGGNTAQVVRPGKGRCLFRDFFVLRRRKEDAQVPVVASSHLDYYFSGIWFTLGH